MGGYDVLVRIGENGCEEVGLDSEVEQQGCDTKTEECVSLLDTLQEVGHQLAVVRFTELVDVAHDLAVVWIVLLLDFADCGDQCVVTPVVLFVISFDRSETTEGRFE